MAPKSAPPLNAPASKVTVKISAIDTTLTMSSNLAGQMWSPKIPGFEKADFGIWSFLIEHPSGRKLVYDLGTRKDWRNLAPAHGLVGLVEGGVIEKLEIEDDVAGILKRNGVKLEDVEGVVWSHWHFDHTGDPSTFPASTKLIVGPGFKEVFTPGYPADPEGRCLETDFAGRELQEIDFGGSDITIGRFNAFDYFGDGSFYILDAPGHTIGHINALARTHPSPEPGFVHLGGDSAHHAAEIRPSEYLPLPDSISPSPLPHLHANTCPGHIFTPLLKDGSKTEHILEWQDPWAEFTEPKFGLIYDEKDLRDTVRKDEELDANRDILTFLAHDWSLKGMVSEFPESLNGWREEGWKGESTWRFLGVFEKAVAQ
ncbi:uncharacterized protein LTR77_007778 [Saxophila tyrrhenica]|uniref:Metallo-beta-lactamase domain-containing protein n=1 Tax=Saxophila tyrrhenica TaxID=1690608 RepID=A0AAV9P507_9PEZI|nr:hypothetical protein LTR77_007778 [Saxophila tyrrhenica]